MKASLKTKLALFVGPALALHLIIGGVVLFILADVVKKFGEDQLIEALIYQTKPMTGSAARQCQIRDDAFINRTGQEGIQAGDKLWESNKADLQTTLR